MVRKKKWSASAKFEIALLAIKGETTLNEICRTYTVAPSRAWKKQLLEQGAGVFIKSEKAALIHADYERKEHELYGKIGQLMVERDYLKKCFGKLHEIKDDS